MAQCVELLKKQLLGIGNVPQKLQKSLKCQIRQFLMDFCRNKFAGKYCI